MTRLPPALLLLAALSALPELVLLAADYGLVGAGHWRRQAYQNYAFWAGLMGDWRPNYPAQPYAMFVTYAFLHSGPMHMITNMAILLGFGPVIWRQQGGIGFGLIYLTAILGGALVFGMLSDGPRPMVGASGALFGLMGAWIAHNLSGRRKDALPLWPIGMMILGLTTLNAFTWWLQSGALAWETHLGGFIAGWVVMWALSGLKSS